MPRYYYFLDLSNITLVRFYLFMVCNADEFSLKKLFKRLFFFLSIDSYSGLWEVPLTQWQCDESGVIFGTMVDECEDDGSEKGVFDLIMRNFNSHYQANKQPFPIFGHSPWFEIGSYRKDGNIILDVMRNLVRVSILILHIIFSIFFLSYDKVYRLRSNLTRCFLCDNARCCSMDSITCRSRQ